MTTMPEIHSALVLWGYAEPDPDARTPAAWERARLAVQAGDFLAQHTKRPTPSAQPPTHEERRTAAQSLVVDGWVQVHGWRPIVPTAGPRSLAAVDSESVVRRMVAGPSAAPAALRRLIDRAVRILHHPAGLPDGVALTLGVTQLPDDWWTYLSSGWLATLTGAEGQSIMLPLPAVQLEAYDHRRLTEAMRWLQEGDDLHAAQAVFDSRTPVAQHLMEDAMTALRYDVPGINDRPTRVQMARLLRLYASALDYGDQPVIDLVTNLHSTYASRRPSP